MNDWAKFELKLHRQWVTNVRNGTNMIGYTYTQQTASDAPSNNTTGKEIAIQHLHLREDKDQNKDYVMVRKR